MGLGSGAAPGENRANVESFAFAQLRSRIIWDTQRALLDYWNDIRGERSMPSRADFDPASVPRLLSRIGLIDVVRPGPRFRYRVVGSDIARDAPYRLEGTFIDALPDSNYALHLSLNFNLVCGLRQPLYIIENMNYQTEYVETVSHLILPLGSAPPEVDMILYSTMNARNADDRETLRRQPSSDTLGRTVMAMRV